MDAAQKAHMESLEKVIAALSGQVAAQSAQLAALAPKWPEHTVEELYRAGFDSHWRGTKSEDWLRWLVDRRILPALGSLQLRDLTAQRVEAFVKTLENRPTLRNRVVAYLKIAWNMARRWEWVPVDANPFKAVEKNAEAPRQRCLDRRELAAWEVARAYLEANAPSLVTRRACRAFRLALLCAFRPAEAFKLRRDAVDWDKRTVKLVDHKTVKYVGARTVALPRQAIELLRNTPPVGDSPYFFPGKLPNRPLVDPSAAFEVICERAGLKDVQIRDLRRTWGSTALERGIPMKAISLQLGHTTIATTEKHCHMKFKSVSDVADRMGDL